MKLNGYFAGIPVIQEEGGSTLPSDICALVRPVNLFELLGIISKVSYRVSESGEMADLWGVPISNGALAYVAMRALECSGPRRIQSAHPGVLARACSQYYRLAFRPTDSEGEIALVLRLGSALFELQTLIPNALPRTVKLYGEVWKTEPKASSMDIDEVFQSVIGLSLPQVVILGCMYWHMHKENVGMATIEQSDISSIILPQHVDLFSHEVQETFISWCSTTVSDYKRDLHYLTQKTAKSGLSQYRWNPLTKRPIIRTSHDDWFVAPVPRLIHDRITKGLYYDFADHYNTGRQSDNQFKSVFGSVLERYVVELLQHHLQGQDVSPDFAYGPRRRQKHSPDAIVMHADKVVYIEVKQSGLYQASKMFGDVGSVERDLRKTLRAGVTHIAEFQADVQQVDELARFRNFPNVQRLIVCHDSLSFSNSLLHKILIDTLESEDSFHVITTEELEVLMNIPNLNLYEFLERKAKVDPHTDFRNHLSRNYPDIPIQNDYLMNSFLNFGSQYLTDTDYLFE